MPDQTRVDPRPNIVLLIAEDAGRAVGCYGDRDAITPNLDRFASQGCRYDNAFSTSPVCAPARGTIVTGRYPWRLGHHHMRSTLARTPRTFMRLLKESGYHVSWPTKTDFNFEMDPADVSDTADWVSRLSDGSLPQDRPWFLFVNGFVTHESTMWDRPDMDGGWASGACAERQAAEPSLAGITPSPEQVRVPAYLPGTPVVRTDIARFCQAMHLQDRFMGGVLGAIERSPRRENTVVLFLTDHGRGLPREKRWCYDAGTHLSLLVRWPGKIAAGSVSRRLVSWVDLAPTILSIAGVPIPPDLDGTAFLGDAAGPDRQAVFVGRDRMDEVFDHIRGVRTERFLYLRNTFPHLPYDQPNRYGEHMATMKELRRLHAAGSLDGSAGLYMAPAKPAEELYDSASDPDMVQNLAVEPQYRDILATLRRELDNHLAEAPDLGRVSERELVLRGVVVDRIDEFRQRISDPSQVVLELQDAEARAPWPKP